MKSPRMTFTADDEDAFFARQQELMTDFGAWLGGGESVESTVSDFGLLLDWKWAYGDGRLDRWDRGDLSDFLLGWCPRKLSVPADVARELPSNVAQSIRFLADREMLSVSTRVADLADHALSLRDTFLQRMSDPANFGMAKSLFASAGIEDPESLTPELLQGLMDDFNALPERARRTITDSPLAAAAQRPGLGLIQFPDSAAVLASAEEAPLWAGFDILADYFAAPGKTLTKTGAIKIADATALAELLDTGDKQVDVIGDQTFRKQSARDFGGVDLWLWWARETGVLRPYRGKLVTVKAWQRRHRVDPLAELSRAFEVLLEAGPIRASDPYLYTDFHQSLDETWLAVLAALLKRRRQEFDELVASWAAVLTGFGLSEPYPRALSRALDTVLSRIERCGLVTQDGVGTESEAYGSRRVGGTVRLTPVGVPIIAKVLERWGFAFDVAPPPTEQSAADLVELVAATGDAEEWWSLTTAWLDVQPTAAVAVGELIDQLRLRSLAQLVLALNGAPETEHDRLAVVLRALAYDRTSADPEVTQVALSWLTEREPRDGAALDQDAVTTSMLLTMGALSEVGQGQLVAASFAEDFDRPTQLDLIGQCGRLLPPLVTDLLAALGEYHLDKQVAKTARKELFRVRSKLTTAATRGK